jgi:hypothetical protein
VTRASRLRGARLRLRASPRSIPRTLRCATRFDIDVAATAKPATIFPNA